MKKNKIVKIIVGISLIFLLGWKKTIEKLNVAIVRNRYKFGFPLLSSKKKTYIIKDVNKYNGETVIHIFNYWTEKAYQFLNGSFNQVLNIWDVK